MPEQPMVDASAAVGRFFVALLPPKNLQETITAIQHDIGQRFGSKAALRSPPHITLQPPFQWPLDRTAELERSLHSWVCHQPPIPIALERFSAFAPRVIYIDVVQTPELMAIQPALITHLHKHCGLGNASTQPRPFCPHVTVAFRDLTPAAFRQAWPEFKQRPFSAEFVVSALTLLRHDGQRWQIFSDFLLNRSTP
ncbi:2'-5' RNA ligase family protein [Nodosilinea sp. E11]|uniref:2'-5' RNA ligase family protein n=1 Tax=Nodosilinea sp. E11 TaxID=3037479 RepID=UPI00293500C8|nr:2'-5' RNA ligase family protein [Nodosilinea sp. E11]WOD39152.1 2'-5' RNA ligase family protein [Nodosilinea sp. E11]